MPCGGSSSSSSGSYPTIARTIKKKSCSRHKHNHSHSRLGWCRRKKFCASGRLYMHEKIGEEKLRNAACML
ncbi:hypothetical protein GQ55_1G447900 [Panicum hallii var. hallii]|uniref:Uncharacterized protein n=1 Tax=Panicum hallii var. hallii TaxID=1504633 RepID=A0A2T7FE65_9POAL|nr:hypothetical protein GQ55_1G447900 [Panicum hallii var. hallii]